MSLLQQHAHCVFKQKKNHWCTVWTILILGEQVDLQVFLKSFLPIMLFQSNGQPVPQFGCSIEKCSDSKMFLLFPWSTLGMRDWVEDRRWRTGRLLVPEDTGGLCHSCSCTQETRFCSQYLPNWNELFWNIFGEWGHQGNHGWKRDWGVDLPCRR